MEQSSLPTQDPSWRGHFRATFRLGLPLVGSQLATIGLGVTDTVMLGWLGAESLAAGVLGTQLFFVFFLTGSGLAHAVSPMVAVAAGEGDDITLRRSVRMGLWSVLIFAALSMPILWQANAIFVGLGQEPVLSALAADYLRIAQWALVLGLAHSVLRSYLSAMELAGIVLWASIAGLGLNLVLDYGLIFGAFGLPAMGIRGAALATLGVHFLILVILVVYAARHHALAHLALFQRFWRADWGMLRAIFLLGWPISLTLLAEVSLFSLSSIMLGWIGTVELAAHGIALQIISVIFMIPLGLAFAATVRVGRAAGRKDPQGVWRAAMTVIGLAVLVAGLAAVALLAFPETLIRLFMDNDDPVLADVIAYGVPLLAVAAGFQLVDMLQVVAAALLRGLKDTRLPMMIAIVSYLGFGMITAYILGFHLEYGGIGVWAGLAAGLLLASVLLLWRFVRLVRLLPEG